MNKIKTLKKEITNNFYILKTYKFIYGNNINVYLVNIDNTISIFKCMLSRNINEALKFNTLKAAKNFISNYGLIEYYVVKFSNEIKNIKKENY